MFIKPIKYVDFNGTEKTKNFYFNYSVSELTKMNLLADGGMKEWIKKMINEDDNRKIVNFFEDFVLGAYGEKSADGESFIKNDDIREKFKNHPAYDALFMELIAGGDKAMADFFNAVIPNDIASKITEADKEEAKKELFPTVDQPDLKVVK